MANIGAETARWAGLQIDLHSKFRSGNLTADQLEWWLNQTVGVRDTLMIGEKPIVKKVMVPTEKFILFIDLGIITVPADYDHAKWLTSFKKKNQKRFYDYDNGIADQNFSNPSRVLKPRDMLRVRAFKQIVGRTTTSEERIVFLSKQNAVYTGAQGASLVFDQKRDQLPIGNWYVSFDEKERLWRDSNVLHRVPYVYVNSVGVFHFRLGNFEYPWDSNNILLCFCDLPAGKV